MYVASSRIVVGGEAVQGGRNLHVYWWWKKPARRDPNNAHHNMHSESSITVTIFGTCINLAEGIYLLRCRHLHPSRVTVVSPQLPQETGAGLCVLQLPRHTQIQP